MLLGIALRFLLLDADPHYYEWGGYITDEGRWTDRARELALFGRTLEPPWSLHVLVAPLFQLTTYVTFALTDVSVVSSRLLPAVSGSIVPIAFWAAFRRATTPEALFLGIVPMALQVDLVTLSRVAVPEMPIIALQFALYLGITSQSPSVFGRVGAGLLALATVAMKITAVPAVAILSLLLLLPVASPGDARRRGTSLLAFLAGLVGPVLLLGLGGIACCPRFAEILGSTVGRLRTFLGVSSPFDVVSFPFENPLAPELNLWGLALWYALIGWRATRPDALDRRTRYYLITSTAWCGSYLGIMQLASYFPNRYKVHMLLPMCITVAVGVGLLQRAGIRRAESAFVGPGRFWHLVGLAFLGLPTAAFASPLVADLVNIFGWDPTRLRTKLVTLAASWVAMISILEWRRRQGGRVRVFMLFPVVAAFAWYLAVRVALPETTFWPTPDSPRASIIRLLVLLAAAILSVAITIRLRPLGLALPAGITLSAVGYAFLALVQLAPGYLTPHYSIRDTSRELGRLLAGFPGTVATSGGDGLFRENRLPYTTVWGRRWPREPLDKPEVIVVVFAFLDPEDRLAREYCQIGEYPLYVAPTYYRAHPMQWPTSALGTTARVYRRRPPSSVSAAMVSPPSSPAPSGLTSEVAPCV